MVLKGSCSENIVIFAEKYPLTELTVKEVTVFFTIFLKEALHQIDFLGLLGICEIFNMSKS